MTYLPTSEEKAEAYEFVALLQREILIFFGDKGIKVEAIPVGSTVKGTFVSGEHDVDFYILCDNPREMMILAAAHSQFQSEGFFKHAGELMIWSFKREGYSVDLVFGQPGNIKTDTLKHAEFFNKHLTEAQKNEVIKAKAFFKTKGVYSAEIGGITGVAIEELIRQLGDFESLCDLFAHGQLCHRWLQDPVMTEPRNLLASIIPKRWKQLQISCDEYLATGRFEFKAFSHEEFKASYLGYSFIEYHRKKEMSLDFMIVYSACEHLMREIRNLEHLDARLFGHAGDFDVWLDEKDIVIAVKLPLELEEQRYTEISKNFPEGVEAFKKAHPLWFDAGQFVAAKVPRKITRPLQYFTDKLAKKLDDAGYIPADE